MRNIYICIYFIYIYINTNTSTINHQQMSFFKKRKLTTLGIGIKEPEVPEPNLKENEEDDDKKKSLKDRRSDRKEKAIIGGGLGVMATGMVASLGEFMGYSQSELTMFIHVKHLTLFFQILVIQ